MTKYINVNKFKQELYYSDDAVNMGGEYKGLWVRWKAIEAALEKHLININLLASINSRSEEGIRVRVYIEDVDYREAIVCAGLIISDVADKYNLEIDQLFKMIKEFHEDFYQKE